jgi:hypothetical protein
MGSSASSSFDIACWAPSRDKSIELFSRSSVPPAIVSKDDREWNYILPPIVRGEHIDDSSLFGSRRAVPFRFRHSPTSPRWFDATCLVAVAANCRRQVHLARNGPKLTFRNRPPAPHHSGRVRRSSHLLWSMCGSSRSGLSIWGIKYYASLHLGGAPMRRPFPH